MVRAVLCVASSRTVDHIVDMSSKSLICTVPLVLLALFHHRGQKNYKYILRRFLNCGNELPNSAEK